MNKHIPYEKIARYIKNESSDSEREEIHTWMTDSHENKELFKSLKSEWIHINDSEQKKKYPNKESLWKNIQQRINPISRRTTIHWYKRTATAACIALIIGFALNTLISAITNNSQQEKAITQIHTPSGQKMNMTLPDGTTVWLNAQSTLCYSQNFNKKDRRIQLQGEAFFDVTKNKNKKFIVETPILHITVKGTAFDISAYKTNKNIKISLLRGKISVETSQNKPITEMKPNDYITISQKNLHYSLQQDNAKNHILWTKNELRFYDTNINQVKKQLENWYGVNIQFIHPDPKQKYSFVIKTESLHELLDQLNKITPIQYTIKGKEVSIQYIKTKKIQ